MVNKIFLVLAVGLLLIVAACGAPSARDATTLAITPATLTPPFEATATSTPAQEQTLTMEELIGLWRDVDGYIEFNPDGTWAYTNTLDELRAGQLVDEGTFRVEEAEITFLTGKLCGNKIGVYRLQTKTTDKLTFIQVKEECSGVRMPFLERIP